ncbi:MULTISPECIES: thioredoxin [Enterobacterales]|uniref:thioredoxin n=1 Tax=Enterobacterales TaxID=91347 RepID=UPI000848037F|nr:MULTISPECIES: thioredoxin [Enterobacterales]WOO51540.1 thioredoxin [Hafnia alvei]MCT6516753.1 thioredoxin [Proteus vulgaris]ODQ04574.1 thioredoxin [Shigella sp. FC130]OEI92109.1 thioredoxin [Shigella sp. FC1655]OEJ04937.1 thioredoxin [Shigella sp. FC1967]
MSSLIELNAENFDTTINKEGLCVVRFWAPWCAPCRMVAPIFNQLSIDMKESATFAEVNIDDNPSIASRYAIRSIPTTVVYKEGMPIDSLVGAASLPNFKDLVLKHL